MGGLIGTSRILWDLDFKNKPWAAIGNSFGFPETSAKTTAPHLRHVGKREKWASPLSSIDEYSHPQIRDQPSSNMWGVKVGFGFWIP